MGVDLDACFVSDESSLWDFDDGARTPRGGDGSWKCTEWTCRTSRTATWSRSSIASPPPGAERVVPGRRSDSVRRGGRAERITGGVEVAGAVEGQRRRIGHDARSLAIGDLSRRSSPTRRSGRAPACSACGRCRRCPRRCPRSGSPRCRQSRSVAKCIGVFAVVGVIDDSALVNIASGSSESTSASSTTSAMPRPMALPCEAGVRPRT